MIHDVARSAMLIPPESRATFPLADVEALVVHYSTGRTLAPTHGRYRDWWANIQSFHLHDRGWDDIGYAYGLGMDDDQILEGRGAGVVAAHSPGWNARSISLCLLGDDAPGQDVSRRARVRVVEWRDDCYRLIGREVPVLGHRQTQPPGYTPCPGDEVQGWIDAGMPTDLEDDDMATLERGDRGDAVARVQQALLAWGDLTGEQLLPKHGVDGIFGAETAAGVRAYQAAADPIDVTGRVDGLTAAFLSRYMATA